MFINKKSGDDLALAFAKILNQNKSAFQKTASNCASSADDAAMASDEAMDMPGMDMAADEDDAMDMPGMDLENMAKDMLLDEDMAEDHASDEAMDMGDHSYDAMDMVEDHSYDAMDMAKHAKLMKGLGKIAGSLRRKGETFAG